MSLILQPKPLKKPLLIQAKIYINQKDNFSQVLNKFTNLYTFSEIQTFFHKLRSTKYNPACPPSFKIPFNDLKNNLHKKLKMFTKLFAKTNSLKGMSVNLYPFHAEVQN